MTRCRLCESTDLFSSVLDLGDQRLSDFRSDDTLTNAYPLHLIMCEVCSLVQLADTVPRDMLYHDGYGYRSGTNEAIRQNLSDVVDCARTCNPHARTWLDIASNDGTLLSFVPDTVYRVGVDPIEKFTFDASQHANLIIPRFFDERLFMRGQFDIVTSVSMFYDVEDLNAFVAGVKRILTHSGVWVVQQNYLLDMLRQTSFDNVCHEHLTYFSLRTLSALLRRHGLEIINVELSPINGGVIRTVIAREHTYTVHSSVVGMMAREVVGMTAHTLDDFAKHSRSLIDSLHTYVRSSSRIHFIYGASTRGATMWQAADITRNQVPYAVERSPEKIGKYYSALGIPIISEEDARSRKPDVMLVGPWWHSEQFVAREAVYLREGGRLLFPIPNMQEV